MTKEEFIKAWATAMLEHPEWRPGQAFYNTLYELAPAMASFINGDAVRNPFYEDANLGAAWVWAFGGNQIERTNY